MKCRACGAEIRWGINLDTSKRIPLVPHDGQHGPTTRYSITQKPDGFGRMETHCRRDNAGEWQTHFADCPGANRFGKGKKP